MFGRLRATRQTPTIPTRRLRRGGIHVLFEIKRRRGFLHGGAHHQSTSTPWPITIAALDAYYHGKRDQPGPALAEAVAMGKPPTEF